MKRITAMKHVFMTMLLAGAFGTVGYMGMGVNEAAAAAKGSQAKEHNHHDNKGVPHTLTNDEAAKELRDLVQHEIDGSFALSQAIDSLNNQETRKQLEEFKRSCEDNIKLLSDEIHKLGREAPTYSRDFKGFLMQGYATIRGLPSDEGVLRALRTNLKIGLDAFDRDLKLHFPGQASDVMAKVYASKKRVIEYIDQQLQAKVS